ncbi:MAG: PLP-dependent aminotransferase family protein [Rhodoferax sp.]|nr:PLP-dependent aminotransferase family protein [Rhodoferax sp.]
MSFEQLISTASLGDGSKPKYQSIAEDLAQAILNGQVPMGEKLPPQRNLAHRLGVTTGTISRAYAILERQGLATARVGDGTYVRSAEHVPASGDSDHQQPIDLAHNVAMVGDESAALQQAFQSLGTDAELMRQVLSYQSETGMRRHREAGAQWLRRFGTSGQWNRVMVTHGAQHGLACVLRTVARPGDAVLTESLSYPGLQALARSMRLQLIGIETDEQGMVPQALERAAKTFDTKFVYCAPTLHNPTGATMSMARREAVAAVMRTHGLFIIEDCVHAAMQAHPLPALSTWLPEQSFLLSSFSKVLAPGLRVGYVEAAPAWLSKFAASMRADSWMVAPLLPEIATRWLESGAMEGLIAQQRQMTAQRLECARAVLRGLDFKTDAEFPLIWLPLPEPWRAGQFAAALRQAGVLVRTADHFAVGRSPAPHAIRISLNAPASVEQLEAGLQMLKILIDNPPSAAMDP